jgi:hypothetical protein
VETVVKMLLLILAVAAVAAVVPTMTVPVSVVLELL